MPSPWTQAPDLGHVTAGGQHEGVDRHRCTRENPRQVSPCQDARPNVMFVYELEHFFEHQGNLSGRELQRQRFPIHLARSPVKGRPQSPNCEQLRDSISSRSKHDQEEPSESQQQFQRYVGQSSQKHDQEETPACPQELQKYDAALVLKGKSVSTGTSRPITTFLSEACSRRAREKHEHHQHIAVLVHVERATRRFFLFGHLLLHI